MNKEENPFRRNELEFCDIIAEVGYNNKDNPSWWASSISSRNFGISSLWKNLEDYLSGKLKCRKIFLFSLLAAFIKYLLRIYIIAPPSLRLKKSLVSNEYKVLLFSHLNSDSWNRIDTYEDPYFKGLLGFLEKRGDGFLIIAHTYGNVFSSGRNTINGLYSKRKVVPVELFLSLKDLLKALCLTLSESLRIPQNIMFGNKNISGFLAKQYRKEKYSGEIFFNLCLYMAYRNIFEKIKPERILWPWENHSWERLMLIAGKKYSEKSFTIAYQHSSLICYLLNFFPGRKEPEYAPFPDRIVTDGEITYEILAKYGHFPQGCLKRGCALRYDYLHDYGRRKGLPGNRIGIIFSYREPSLAMLSILDETACRLGENYKYILRFHPFIPYEKIVKNSGMEFRYVFTDISKGTAENFFDGIDILIYSETTMCLEALKIGIPIIYIDTGKGLCGDVSFNNTELKWAASNPKELINALNDIKNTSIEKMEKARENARRYVDKYFYPVTEENLKIFADI